MYADKNIQQYHSIIVSISVNYDEQIVITDIKSGIQCLMYQVSSKKHKNLYKIWSKKTHNNTRI